MVLSNKKPLKKSLVPYHFRLKERKLHIFIASKALAVKPVWTRSVLRLTVEQFGLLRSCKRALFEEKESEIFQFTAVQPSMGQGIAAIVLGTRLLSLMQSRGMVGSHNKGEGHILNPDFMYMSVCSLSIPLHSLKRHLI